MYSHERPATRYYAGIDLHKQSLRLHVIDATGAPVYQETIRKDKYVRLRTVLGRFGREVTVGVESTYNWYWVIDLLRREGIPCQLGHARDVHRQQGKHKSDVKDAEAISRMVWLGTLPPAYCYPAEWRATRDVLRKRLRLVWEHTRHGLHGAAVADQYLIEEGPLAARHYPASVVADVERVIEIDLQMQNVLATMIQQLEDWAVQRATAHDPELYRVLTAIPGVGPVIALTLIYEIHTIERFRSPQAFSSYARLVNAQCESSGKRVGPGDTKCGNPYLCRVLHMLAIISVRTQPRIAAWYHTLIHNRGRHTARRILAHRWAVAVYAIWKRREAFDLNKFLGTAAHA